MASYDYHFVTHWKIKGSPERIFEILQDGARYSEWWTPAYTRTRRIGDKEVEAVVRARVPYSLTFTTVQVRERLPLELEIRSKGELEGTGLWKLQAAGEFTQVDFYWDVRTNKPWVRRLSFLLKPLFRWNHDWVMKTGEKCLQRELDRRM